MALQGVNANTYGAFYRLPVYRAESKPGSELPVILVRDIYNPEESHDITDIIPSSAIWSWYVPDLRKYYIGVHSSGNVIALTPARQIDNTDKYLLNIMELLHAASPGNMDVSITMYNIMKNVYERMVDAHNKMARIAKNDPSNPLLARHVNGLLVLLYHAMRMSYTPVPLFPSNTVLNWPPLRRPDELTEYTRRILKNIYGLIQYKEPHEAIISSKLIYSWREYIYYNDGIKYDVFFMLEEIARNMYTSHGDNLKLWEPGLGVLMLSRYIDPPRNLPLVKMRVRTISGKTYILYGTFNEYGPVYLYDAIPILAKMDDIIGLMDYTERSPLDRIRYELRTRHEGRIPTDIKITCFRYDYGATVHIFDYSFFIDIDNRVLTGRDIISKLFGYRTNDKIGTISIDYIIYA